jgi:ABC-type nitrate/sulfonate/bicarbonate transport system substrate-binding protein
VRTNIARFALLTEVLTGALLAPVAWSQTAPLQKITINYATRTGTSWPMYIALEGGYFQKYGLDVNAVFGVHPAGIAMLVSGEAAMTTYPLEQAMTAASKDGSLIMLASPYRKSLFALMAAKSIASARDLKGKRVGVSQIGDAPYNYAVGLLSKFGLTPKDVQWVPIGTDVNGRAAALVSGRVDATMITAPVYFKLEQQGFKSLANTSDYDDLYAPTVYVFRKTWAAANPRVVDSLIKAHADAIKRFYDDKAFAVKSYIAFDKQPEADVARIYDLYKNGAIFDRVPYVLAPAIKAIVAQQVDPRIAADLKAFDFHKVVDNSTIARLVKDGYFEQLFGAEIKAEEQRKAKLAF